MGPSPLQEHTQMTNYLAYSYMECIVISDELDQKFPDFINSSRSDFIRNEITKPFLKAITNHMIDAIADDGKERRKKKKLDGKDLTLNEFESVIKHLDVGEKKWFKRMLKKIMQNTNIEAGDHKKIVNALLEDSSPISSENRKSWIPSDVENFVPKGEDRAIDMFKELSQPSILNITKARNASAVLTRTFIETSVKYYIRKNSVEIPLAERKTLSKLIQRVITHMEKEKIPQSVIEQGEELLAKNSSTEGLKKSNKWVHSDIISPYIEDIITSWNNYKDFIVECWKE